MLLQVSGYSDRNDRFVTVYFESCHWAKARKLGFAWTNDRNDNFFNSTEGNINTVRNWIYIFSTERNRKKLSYLSLDTEKPGKLGIIQ